MRAANSAGHFFGPRHGWSSLGCSRPLLGQALEPGLQIICCYDRAPADFSGYKSSLADFLKNQGSTNARNFGRFIGRVCKSIFHVSPSRLPAAAGSCTQGCTARRNIFKGFLKRSASSYLTYLDGRNFFQAVLIASASAFDPGRDGATSTGRVPITATTNFANGESLAGAA